jgi:uncharacterized protein (TIGR00730 family)
VRRICVFCGSSTGADPRYAEVARRFGRALASRGLGLVFGGGSIGLMGVLADAVLGAGGEAVGVIPSFLDERELGHRGLSRQIVVDSMHERKALMARMSDAFVALPGGFGTVEEFCEVLTWAQLGLHTKRCALLNVEGFFDPLLRLFDDQVRLGFLSSEHRALVLVGSDPEAMAATLSSIPSGEEPSLAQT